MENRVAKSKTQNKPQIQYSQIKAIDCEVSAIDGFLLKESNNLSSGSKIETIKAITLSRTKDITEESKLTKDTITLLAKLISTHPELNAINLMGWKLPAGRFDDLGPILMAISERKQSSQLFTLNLLSVPFIDTSIDRISLLLGQTSGIEFVLGNNTESSQIGPYLRSTLHSNDTNNSLRLLTDDSPNKALDIRQDKLIPHSQVSAKKQQYSVCPTSTREESQKATRKLPPTPNSMEHMTNNLPSLARAFFQNFFTVGVSITLYAFVFLLEYLKPKSNEVVSPPTDSYDSPSIERLLSSPS